MEAHFRVGLQSFLRTAPGRRGGLTQRPHAHYSAASPRGAEDGVATAVGEAGCDHGYGQSMGKPCEQAHQSTIGSLAIDSGAVACASQGSK